MYGSGCKHSFVTSVLLENETRKTGKRVLGNHNVSEMYTLFDSAEMS